MCVFCFLWREPDKIEMSSFLSKDGTPLGWSMHVACHKALTDLNHRVNEHFVWINEVIAEAKKTLKTYVHSTTWKGFKCINYLQHASFVFFRIQIIILLDILPLPANVQFVSAEAGCKCMWKVGMCSIPPYILAQTCPHTRHVKEWNERSERMWVCLWYIRIALSMNPLYLRVNKH